MCFEVPALNPPGSVPNGKKVDDADDDDLGIMDIDDNDSKSGFPLFIPFMQSNCPMCFFLWVYTHNIFVFNIPR